MNKIKRNIKRITRMLNQLRFFVSEIWKNRDRKIPTYSYYMSKYFSDYIEAHSEWDTSNLAIVGISFNPKIPIRLLRRKIIFYTAENVHVPESAWQQHEHLYLDNPKVILSLGFDYIDHPQYYRWPFWMSRHFDFFDTKESIQSKIEAWNNHTDRVGRTKSCALICRADYFGDRAIFSDMMESVVPMTYPGMFRHNDDELFGDKYNNNKNEYLRQFKFNLCPENSDSEGYVTEKLFDAISAGCIPVYWGSGNDPEPGIFNKDAIIFLTLDGDNTEALAKIKLLAENQEAYEEFVKQPYFTPEAADIIYDMIHGLEEKMASVLQIV